jgi:hypothetical protein
MRTLLFNWAMVLSQGWLLILSIVMMDLMPSHPESYLGICVQVPPMFDWYFDDIGCFDLHVWVSFLSSSIIVLLTTFFQPSCLECEPAPKEVVCPRVVWLNHGFMNMIPLQSMTEAWYLL